MPPQPPPGVYELLLTGIKIGEQQNAETGESTVAVQWTWLVLSGEHEQQTITDRTQPVHSKPYPVTIHKERIRALGYEVPDDPCEYEQLLPAIEAASPRVRARVTTGGREGQFRNVKILEVIGAGPAEPAASLEEAPAPAPRPSAKQAAKPAAAPAAAAAKPAAKATPKPAAPPPEPEPEPEPEAPAEEPAADPSADATRAALVALLASYGEAPEDPADPASVKAKVVSCTFIRTQLTPEEVAAVESVGGNLIDEEPNPAAKPAPKAVPKPAAKAAAKKR
jgi:hypothetical protein